MTLSPIAKVPGARGGSLGIPSSATWLPPLLTEAQWQGHVIGRAKACGWKVFHFRPGMDRSGKWHTAVQGDVGFPDLVLVRDRVLFRELKTAKGQLKPAQVQCIAAFRTAGADVDVWRPADWARVQAELA